LLLCIFSSIFIFRNKNSQTSSQPLPQRDIIHPIRQTTSQPPSNTSQSRKTAPTDFSFHFRVQSTTPASPQQPPPSSALDFNPTASRLKPLSQSKPAFLEPPKTPNTHSGTLLPTTSTPISLSGLSVTAIGSMLFSEKSSPGVSAKRSFKRSNSVASIDSLPPADESIHIHTPPKIQPKSQRTTRRRPRASGIAVAPSPAELPIPHEPLSIGGVPLPVEAAPEPTRSSRPTRSAALKQSPATRKLDFSGLGDHGEKKRRKRPRPESSTNVEPPAKKRAVEAKPTGLKRGQWTHFEDQLLVESVFNRLSLGQEIDFECCVRGEDRLKRTKKSAQQRYAALEKASMEPSRWTKERKEIWDQRFRQKTLPRVLGVGDVLSGNGIDCFCHSMASGRQIIKVLLFFVLEFDSSSVPCAEKSCIATALVSLSSLNRRLDKMKMFLSLKIRIDGSARGILSARSFERTRMVCRRLRQFKMAGTFRWFLVLCLLPQLRLFKRRKKLFQDENQKENEMNTFKKCFGICFKSPSKLPATKQCPRTDAFEAISPKSSQACCAFFARLLPSPQKFQVPLSTPKTALPTSPQASNHFKNQKNHSTTPSSPPSSLHATLPSSPSLAALDTVATDAQQLQQHA
jgi:hypothetical protein